MNRMKGVLFLLALAVFSFSALTFLACQKEEETTVSDEEAISDIIASSPLFDVTSYYEGGPVSDSGDTNPELFAFSPDTIIPFLWGREIQNRPDPRIKIHIDGDSAFVEYTGFSEGFFDILTHMPDTGWIVLKKPLSETYEIKAIFKRTGEATAEDRGWELTHISGVWGYSDSVHTVRIDSVRIQCESYPDTVFRDPTEMFFNVDSIITLTPGEEVILTVYTNDGSARAFLHVFQSIFPFHLRIPFLNQGGGIYQNLHLWRVQPIPQVRLAVFDFLQWETLFDSEYPYDFDGWLFPYQVVSE